MFEVDCCVITLQQSKKKNVDSAATWTNDGLVSRDEITDECMGELHLMLNQLRSGSISCSRPVVETERLVRSNERQDRRSVLLFCEPRVTGLVYLDMLEQFVYPQVAVFQSSRPIINKMGFPNTGVWMFEGPSMQHFPIDGLDATDRYVGHHFHRI